MTSPAWMQRLVEGAIEPGRVQEALQQLAERWPAALPLLPEVCLGFVDEGAALAHLLSVSPISAGKLSSDPAALVWLARGNIHETGRGPVRMRADYEELRRQFEGEAAAFDPRFQALRRWKAREMLRIALREVAGWSSIEQSTLELTIVAELCLQIVCRGWLEELTRKWGRPATNFAVLGMGKLGGHELNYSSDIDVMLFFGEDGRLNPRFTHQEFFARLAEKIIATFSANDPAGPLFRIDLRLRPEGVSGPLVRSLESMEHYYAAFGETWERMALIKARVVAGTDDAK
ncbi:MAG: hypothetical protein M3463_20325, partial [Verrucomicrobiota bacterium]|nr:hypothetical protein [Verrucomicrobiota bacterium]